MGMVGDTVMVGNDPDLVDAAVVIDKGSLILDRPLKNDHPAHQSEPGTGIDYVLAFQL